MMALGFCAGIVIAVICMKIVGVAWRDVLVAAIGTGILGAVFLAGQSFGATARTKNFTVETPNPAHAQEFVAAAERYRRDLAVSWLGKEMPNWSAPCSITATVGERVGDGAATSFVFGHGEVFGWQMTVQGSRAGIVNAVLPHEITHMVLASHFRRPVPRWADEGAGMSVEPTDEQARYRKDLIQCLQTRRGLAFDRMVEVQIYPRDMLPWYVQSASAVDYLLQQAGRRTFVRFLEETFRTRDHNQALRTVYKIPSNSEFQTRWLAWVRKGSPRTQTMASAMRPPDT